MNDKLKNMDNSQFITHNSPLAKKGYKQTDVGVIPEDWKVYDFGDLISSTQLGGNYPNSEINNGVPLIKMGNLGRGKIVLNKLEFIPSETFPSNRDELQYGDVIFNTRNTLELVGKVAIWRNEMLKAYFNSNIMRFNFNSKKVKSNFYMNYVLNTRNSIMQLKDIATGTTSVAAIYSKDLFKIKIPLPPTKAEQTAIATALSDMDSLIEGLEKLLVKKRNIKQGAMQELLKPKDGWKVKTVAEIGKPYGGLSGKSKNDFENGTTPYIPFMNIISNPIIDITYFDYVKVEYSENQNKAQKGDLFFNTSSETPEEVGMCSALLEDIPSLYLNSFCFGFRFHKETKDDGLYLS